MDVDMKTKLLTTIAALTAAFLIQPATAETKAEDYPGLLAASDVTGAKVKNLQNEEVGDVHELLIDPNTKQVRYAVLSVGGFLGIGDTKVAVPFAALRVNKEGDTTKYTLDTTKERLEKAPRVEGKNYDRLFSREGGEPTFVYWGITWYDIQPMTSGTTASPSPSPTASPTASPKK